MSGVKLSNAVFVGAKTVYEDVLLNVTLDAFSRDVKIPNLLPSLSISETLVVLVLMIDFTMWTIPFFARQTSLLATAAPLMYVFYT